MIRTKCPHCGKLLGINDSGAGTAVLCPVCKQKFRVPAGKPAAPGGRNSPAAAPRPAPKAPPAEEFPDVEVVEEEDRDEPRRPARAPLRKRRPPVEDQDEDVAEVERDEVVDDDDEPRPKRRPGKRKKKRYRKDETDPMALRNRIVGGIGALGGIALTVIGVTKSLPEKLTDPKRSVLKDFAEYSWYIPTIFGALLFLVGLFYVIKPTSKTSDW